MATRMKLHRHQAIKLNTKSLDRVVGDDRGIYVGDLLRKTLALEPDDYRVRWEMNVKGLSPVLAAGNTVVLGRSLGKGDLRGVDALTGATRWTKDARECFPWRDGLLRYTRHDGVVCSFDPATGQVVEEIALGTGVLILDDWHALVTATEHAERCIDLRNRSVVWESPIFDVAGEAAGTSSCEDGCRAAYLHPPGILVVQRGSGLAAFGLGAGETRWTAALPGEPQAAISVDLGCVVATTSHDMIAFDVNDGHVRWIRPRPDPPAGHVPEAFVPPRHVFRGMFLSKERDGLYLIDAASGTTAAAAPGLTFADVAAVGDKLVAVRYDGRLNVFGLDRQGASPRPPRPAARGKVTKAKGGPLAFEEIARVKLPGLRWPSRAIRTIEAVFVSDPDHGVIKIGRDGWRIEWRKPAGTPELAWAVGGMVFAPLARRERIVAFRASDGERAWEAESQRGQVWPLDERRVVVAPLGPGRLRVLEVATGRVLQTIDSELPRVLAAAGGLVALSRFLPAADDLGDALRAAADEPGADQGLAEAEVADDAEAFERLLQGTGGRFAVIDVEGGRTIWSRELEPALKDMAGLDVKLSIRVVGTTDEWLLLSHSGRPSYGRDLWGVSMVTGAVAWHVQFQGHDALAFDGAYVWKPIDDRGFECVDIQTGTLKRRHAVTATRTYPQGSYGAYLVSANTRKVDFYHPDHDTQRLDLENGMQVLLGAPPELLLIEGGRLRVFRETSAG